MNLPRVSVLLSAYNGEKYIAEQIDSILCQIDVDIQLLIRDDGSIDNTPSICRDYAEKYKNVTFVQGSNIGVGRSFLELLRKADNSDYYSFADQDDVWFDDKLIRAISKIQEVNGKDLSEYIGIGQPITDDLLPSLKSISQEQNLPVLYGSNLLMVDNQLNKIGLRFREIPSCDFLSCISKNIIYGCTMVMNDALRRICINIENPSDRVLARKNHDGWILYIAYITGVFLYDNCSYICYRQHTGQVVGAKEIAGFPKVIDKLKRLINAKNKALRSTLAKDLLDRFSDKMNKEMKYHLEILSKANTYKGYKRIMRDNTLLDSFNESKGKVFIRSMIKWI